jgi:transcriptional regulator with XRE-family HTH domain
MNIKDVRKRLLKNPEFKKEYEKLDLPFEISKMIIKARIYRNLTQEDLARKLSTKQSSIARLESEKSLPSLSFLKRVADVLKMNLIPPKFEPKEVITTIRHVQPARTEDHKIYLRSISMDQLNASNAGFYTGGVS